MADEHDLGSCAGYRCALLYGKAFFVISDALNHVLNAGSYLHHYKAPAKLPGLYALRFRRSR